MENKINIAELLKDCPTGMELDCLIYEDVYFDYIDELNIIHCYIQYETHKTSLTFNQHGTPNSNIKSKCVIFPKGKTTWERFQRPFKDGDIVVTSLGSITIISNKINNIMYHTYCGLIGHDAFINCGVHIGPKRLATEEEKQRLFQAIKDNGYNWNAETKTLEKLIEPRFKVGNTIQDKNGYKVKITEVNIEDECYGYESIIAKGIGGIAFSEQDNWELVPNKFDITTLKPFDKVLYRMHRYDTWLAGFYNVCIRNNIFVIGSGAISCCIPYRGNEHLLGTTDDCDDFYKTWEE